jgi:hypothetical protein
VVPKGCWRLFGKCLKAIGDLPLQQCFQSSRYTKENAQMKVEACWVHFPPGLLPTVSAHISGNFCFPQSTAVLLNFNSFRDNKNVKALSGSTPIFALSNPQTGATIPLNTFVVNNHQIPFLFNTYGC